MSPNSDRDQLSRLGAAAIPKSDLVNQTAPVEGTTHKISDVGKRVKFNYLGAPAVFELQLACQHLSRAFPGRCYIVGSVLKRADYRDVDIRMIVDDADFRVLFPDVHSSLQGHWENDPRWLLMTSMISHRLSAAIGKLVDFQFQPQGWNASKHKGEPRHPIGYFYAPENKDD